MQEQQSQFEAAVVFLDSVVTQVTAAHLMQALAGSPAAADKAGILRELQALLQQVLFTPVSSQLGTSSSTFAGFCSHSGWPLRYRVTQRACHTSPAKQNSSAKAEAEYHLGCCAVVASAAVRPDAARLALSSAGSICQMRVSIP